MVSHFAHRWNQPYATKLLVFDEYLVNCYNGKQKKKHVQVGINK